VGSRQQLRTGLTGRTTGGIYFTTLQKFGRTDAERHAGLEHPLLSDRRNIIVIVDEAHRSHYDDRDGFARHIRRLLVQYKYPPDQQPEAIRLVIEKMKAMAPRFAA
jgi:type I restriction enzyme R subunit